MELFDLMHFFLLLVPSMDGTARHALANQPPRDSTAAAAGAQSNIGASLEWKIVHPE
jgi:hypothetical protein